MGHSKNGALYRSVAFSASKNQDWGFIEKLLDDLNIKYKIRNLKDDLGESSQIIFFNKYDIINFFNYINKNNDYENIGLKRKFDKFIKLKSYII